LAAEYLGLDDDNLQAFGRGVDRSREPGGSRIDHRNVNLDSEVELLVRLSRRSGTILWTSPSVAARAYSSANAGSAPHVPLLLMRRTLIASGTRC
jgi:hypothetical protein